MNNSHLLVNLFAVKKPLCSLPKIFVAYEKLFAKNFCKIHSIGIHK